MNRFLLDFGEQDQDIANDTPLRGDHPRFRRTELLDGTKSIVPRKWFLASTPQEAIDEDPEQCSAQKFRHSNCIKIKKCPLIPKQTYAGDRFLPCRRSYSFETAHYLLTKENTPEDTLTIDVCKQVNSLDVTYRRKAMRAMLIERAFMPDLNRDQILRFSGNSTVQSQNPPRPEYEKKGCWKCTPRKRILIGSAEKMLCMPDSTASEGNSIKAVDWSCNDTVAVGDQSCVAIYDNNGVQLSSYAATESSEHIHIGAIKWSHDGTKLAISIYTLHSSRLVLHDLEKKKSLWEADCKCFVSDSESCFIRCICWSAHDRHIITGCTGTISIYASDTGDLLRSKFAHASYILTLSFSPNFKYLVSTARDKTVRVFDWPELSPCFDIEFVKPVKAIAWHPQVSDLLCIGGGMSGSLSLWNVNKSKMIAFVRSKFDGRVENLAWNKLSGELLVHWTYREGDNRYTVVPVLASLNRIVDVLPLDKEMQLSFLKFNATHDQLLTYCSSVWSIWNFFGNDKSFRGRYMPLYSSKRRRQGVIVHNPIR